MLLSPSSNFKVIFSLSFINFTNSKKALFICHEILPIFWLLCSDLWVQFLQGYAYILTHPGIPTVFYDHFYDWGDSIHDQIVKLVCYVTIFTYRIVLFECTIVKLLKCACSSTFESVRTFTADHLLVFWRHSQISTLQSLGRKCAWRLGMDHGVQRAESGH
jgi:hypothetical protein